MREIVFLLLTFLPDDEHVVQRPVEKEKISVRSKLFLQTRKENSNFVSYIPRVLRGVRSDVQLSCTENRFQKCSQSGKNGSKHPMLSISMAYNVISCKKIEGNTQKVKIADL